MKKIIKQLTAMAMTFIMVITFGGNIFAENVPTIKEEVVYGLLAADGALQRLYVVNRFEAEHIVDYGAYTEVANMTSTEALVLTGNQIEIQTQAETFYYQGILEDRPLPWTIAITYNLEGDFVLPEDLAGESGHLIMMIDVSGHQAVDATFFDHYLLQITTTLADEVATNIEAPNGTIATAGQNKMITHTVLPGQGGQMLIAADVVDFQMPGMEINALPYNMTIDLPDFGDDFQGLVDLSEGIKALSLGTQELSDGLTQISDGARSLQSGSASFYDGLGTISQSGSSLSSGSIQIQRGLESMVQALNQNDGMGLEDLAQLPEALKEMALGLDALSESLDTLSSGYNQSYEALKASIDALPTETIDPTELYGAVQGRADLTEAIDDLMAYYAGAKTVQGTFNATREAFDAIQVHLPTMTTQLIGISEGLSTVASHLEAAFDEMAVGESMGQLYEGLYQMQMQYQVFHEGLVAYLNGVTELYGGYSGIYSGLRDLNTGLTETQTGSQDLAEGMGLLAEETAHLPEELQTTMEALTEDFTATDFTPISFVSEKNTQVLAVQFVIKTEAITPKQAIVVESEEQESLNFWQRLLRLFGLY